MTTVSADDFGAFFSAIHDCEPFPWQKRIAKQVANEGIWPSVLDLPTGSGKTAAIDIAVFLLALEADRGNQRRAPVRIAFVVDRRLVVDDAFERAKKIATKLADPTPGSVLARVAERLRGLSGNDRPLIARRLRGGVPREHDWARTPAQPTVLCSTVDQIGSRLLFRGYGVSDRMKPVHAGLIGSDCLILLDEAHLAEPFRQTLEWVSTYRSKNWRDPETSHEGPWGVSLLTATPGQRSVEPFVLDTEDYENETLARRLSASKPVQLIVSASSKTKAEDNEQTNETEEIHCLREIVHELRKAFGFLNANGIKKPAIGLVVNRVRRARLLFEWLKSEPQDEIGEPILMIGAARPVDRDDLVRTLDPIRTRIWKPGEPRVLDKTLVIVATQCIEAGVDIDLDALITEAASLDALRQRFGRLNRAGRDILPYGAVVITRSVLESHYDDPVYARAIKPTWEYLTLGQAKTSKGPPTIADFGLNSFRDRMKEKPVPDNALSPKDNAPVLLPAHLDLMSQTSPVPAADPETSLFLHGANREPDSVTVVWRADIDPNFQGDDELRRLLMLIPPRSAEAIQLPRWAVTRWLDKKPAALADLADVAAPAPEEEPAFGRRIAGSERRVFRWKGDDERSVWIAPGEIRFGDTIVVPATCGGVDDFGWNPSRLGPIDDPGATPVSDVTEKAARPFSGRKFAVRVAPGFPKSEALAEALAMAVSQYWQDLRNAVRDLLLPGETAALNALDRAKGGRAAVKTYDDLYGYDDQGRPRGIVFVAQFGLMGEENQEDGEFCATEDDISGSLLGFPLTLETHSSDVEKKAEEFARLAGLPVNRITDLKLAGYLHDAGKVDPRFQAWLHYGDPLGPDPDNPGDVLAKSARLLPHPARKASGLPENWRHEAFSVRLAIVTQRFAEAKDPDLVLWLIGTHHGYGRPFFPHEDPDDTKRRKLPPVLALPYELEPGFGPQSLAFDWNGLDWAGLYERLKARYGVWELARMEAIVRLADHRASEEAADRHFAAGDQ